MGLNMMVGVDNVLVFGLNVNVLGVSLIVMGV